jgi:hypothetical protein
VIELSDEDQRRLEALTRKGTAEARMVERARIVLAAAAGVNNADIADDLAIALNTVIKWRKRFFEEGIVGPRRPQTLGTTEAFFPSGDGRGQGVGVRAAGHHWRAAVEVELHRPRPLGR